MMNYTGKYCFKQDGKIILEGENLITLLGESFFMNRAINEHFEPIQYILLGSGSARPKKSDVSLGNVTVKKRVSSSVDLINKRIILEATFEAGEIIGTSEIGVSNGDVLISHDNYTKMSSTFLEDSIGDVDVTYTFELTTGSMRKDFNKVVDKDYTYWIAEPSLVVGVTEKDTDSGYRCVDSTAAVESTIGSYYYDLATKNLYIHTTRNTNPNLSNIIIETK
jgi:hypothetical protein